MPYIKLETTEPISADQKRGLTMGLAAVCYGERAGYRVSVFDAESKQRLASFDGKAFTIP